LWAAPTAAAATVLGLFALLILLDERGIHLAPHVAIWRGERF
jgi:hypothetical protein